MGKFRKLGRHAAHRISILRTMVSQLVKHERIEATVAKENQKYLETKRTKMGHVYGSDLPGSLPEEFVNPDDTAANPDEDIHD